MKLLKSNIWQYPVGIWISLVALSLIFLAWIMQAYSLLDWQSAVNLGLQNGSFEGDAIDQAMATKERGEAIADLLWVMPISIVAFVGLLKKKFIGLVTAMMTFAICIYFPLFYIFQLWDSYLETALGAVFLWGIPSFAGIIGIWANRDLFKN